MKPEKFWHCFVEANNPEGKSIIDNASPAQRDIAYAVLALGTENLHSARLAAAYAVLTGGVESLFNPNDYPDTPKEKRERWQTNDLRIWEGNIKPEFVEGVNDD